MRIWTILSNTTFRSLGNSLRKSITISTNRYFDNRPLVRMRNSFLKIVSKTKKQKKKKAILTRRTGGRTKRKRNKSRRVAGQSHNNWAKPPYLPCYYAVSFWLGGAVAVRLIFAIFCSFFYQFQSKKGYKKHVRAKYGVFLVCFPLSVQNSLNV